MKADTPSSVDQSPAGGGVGKGRGKGQRKPRKPKAGPGAIHGVNAMAIGQTPMGQGQPPGMQMPVQGGNPQMGHGGMPYGQASGGMQQQGAGQQYGGNSGQQNWYGQNAPQQGYYPPMPGNMFIPII